MDNMTCPNKQAHVSAFPGFDRIKCPYCNKTFVLKSEAVK